MNATTLDAKTLGTGPMSTSTPAHFAWALADTWVIARRHLSRLVHRPDELLGTLLIPVMAVLMFGFVFGDALGLSIAGAAATGVGYREFLMPGVFVLTMAFGVGTTTTAMACDVRDGVLDRMRSLPSSPVTLLAGRALADVLTAVVELAILAALGLAFGWQWHGGIGVTLGAFGLLLLMRLAFSWIGIVLGLVVSGPEVAMKYFALIFPLAMVADTIVPAAVMPGWLAVAAPWNPLSATVMAARELFGNTAAQTGSFVAEHATGMALAWPAAIIAVCVPLALHRLRRLGC